MDESLIAKIFIYGSDIVISNDEKFFMYTIKYPKDLNSCVIKSYLKCFYFNHSMGGRFKCKFSYVKYIHHLVEENQLKLCKMVTIEPLNDYPKITKAGRKFADYVHESHHCKDNFCFESGSKCKATKEIFPLMLRDKK